ncbi:hypothetical protein ACLH9T_004038 [Salmonella enterica]|nr:hypothetical protein [Salmonella enterica]EBG5026806.1 hypothetical protein [Salmonella enterica subsp. enterica serovar Oranienburg]EAS1264492.1 hypothetical protein [Salmonella enterica]EBB1607936.1 hypothetical protein [Salmonella enterica]EBB9533667.1 hypothetical protein [Salmonella enterica]
MPVNSLPFGKTPEEAAYDLVMTLVLSGHFKTAQKTPEEVFRLIDNAEQVFSELYLKKLNDIQEKYAGEAAKDLKIGF